MLLLLQKISAFICVGINIMKLTHAPVIMQQLLQAMLFLKNSI